MEKHADMMHNAVFTRDDCNVISVSADKHIFVSEIIQEELNGSFKYKFKTLLKIETKNYRDIELGNNILVTIGNLNQI